MLLTSIDATAPTNGRHPDGLTLRQAAIVAGFCYLLMPVAYAEFAIYPKIVIPGNIVQTAQNISGHARLFFAAILCYLVTLMLDIVIAWAIYILLAPVNRAVSLLAAWFRLMYTAVALFGLMNLVTVYRMLTTPGYVESFGKGPLQAQADLLLHSYRYDWSMSLIIFGVHLVLVGCLICRSSYIPKIIGILLVVNGFGWMIDSLQPYLYPDAHLGFIFVTFFAELVFMLWLLIRGWKINEPLAIA